MFTSLMADFNLILPYRQMVLFDVKPVIGQ